jgi:hypothetical protein
VRWTGEAGLAHDYGLNIKTFLFHGQREARLSDLNLDIPHAQAWFVKEESTILLIATKNVFIVSTVLLAYSTLMVPCLAIFAYPSLFWWWNRRQVGTRMMKSTVALPFAKNELRFGVFEALSFVTFHAYPSEFVLLTRRLLIRAAIGFRSRFFFFTSAFTFRAIHFFLRLSATAFLSASRRWVGVGLGRVGKRHEFIMRGDIRSVHAHD